jgi:hypothetical protein
VVITLIVISIATWMLSTMPSMRDIPTANDCANKIKEGECAPVEHAVFTTIESICIIAFTVEYFVRLFTVHSVRFALHDENFLVAVLTDTDVKTFKSKRTSEIVPEILAHSNNDDSQEKKKELKIDGKLRTWINFIFNPTNMIDLLAILPWWMQTLDLQAGGGFLVVLRILRLTRIFRIFKLGKLNEVMAIFSRVMEQSLQALMLMIFFILLGCCLFGTLMWFAEAGEWYPEGNPVLADYGISGRGAWMRNTKIGLRGANDEYILEESPFASIVHSFWYVIVTVTTVGYGDVFPVAPAGQVIAAAAIMNGIIVLAMPIGVIGASFVEEFFNNQDRKKKEKLYQIQFTMRTLVEQHEDEQLDIANDSAAMDKNATEILELESARTRIIGQAELLERSWEHVFHGDRRIVGYKLGHGLRCFVLGFFGTNDVAPEVTGNENSAKPLMQLERLLLLDQLTAQVCRSFSAVTSDDELSEFTLKECLECRRKWFQFMESCWDYATDKCRLCKEKPPPDYEKMIESLQSCGTGSIKGEPPS